MCSSVHIDIVDAYVNAFRDEAGTYFFALNRMLAAAGLSVIPRTVMNNVDPSHFVKAPIGNGATGSTEAWYCDIAGYREFIAYAAEKNQACYTWSDRALALLEGCLKVCEIWIAQQEAARQAEVTPGEEAPETEDDIPILFSSSPYGERVGDDYDEIAKSWGQQDRPDGLGWLDDSDDSDDSEPEPDDSEPEPGDSEPEPGEDGPADSADPAYHRDEPDTDSPPAARTLADVFLDGGPYAVLGCAVAALSGAALLLASRRRRRRGGI